MIEIPKVSFEFFPPAPGAAEQRFWQAVDRLAPLGPAFMSLTYGAGGTGDTTRYRNDRIIRGLLARPEVTPAAHLTCVAAPKAEIDAQAWAWAEAGVRRIVALRGDAPNMEGSYRPHAQGYRNAADLVAGLRKVADFDISVAAYPERHPDSPSDEADLDNLKRKLDAGASRALTQYFFDAELFLRFRDAAVKAGIAAPIVPGILPITNFAKVLEFSGRCGASVPDWLKQRFDDLDGDPESRALIAATTASELCQTLLAEGVTEFHFYTLNRASLSYAICRMIGLHPGLRRAA